MFRFCCIVVALITAEAVLLATVQPPMVQQPSTQQVSSAAQLKNPKPPAPPKSGMMPMPIVAPLFIEDETTHSEITMVNSLGLELSVDVVLFSPSGAALVRKKVTMEPRSQMRLRLADLLRDVPIYPDSTYGSVSLMADRPSPLAAQLSILKDDGSSPTDVEEEFAMLTGSNQANYRAVAGELSAAPLIAVRSLSAKEQTLSIGCLMESGRTDRRNLTIKSNQTLLLQACDERGPKMVGRLEEGVDLVSNVRSAMGISVSSSSSAEELAVFGIGIHGKKPNRSFSAIPFWDVNMLRSSTAIYPGVPATQSPDFGIGFFKLRASFANYGNVSRTATVLLSTGSGTESIQKTIATVPVRPNSVATAYLPDAPAESVPLSSIMVRSDAAPGELLSNIQAVSGSETPAIVQTIPWKDQSQPENGGQHPWNTSDSALSTLILFNPDVALANDSIWLTLRTGQITWTKILSLAPLATAAVSIQELITKQEPDDNGQKLPPDTSQGIVTWSTLKNPRIFGKLVQLDPLGSIARSYACTAMITICNDASVQNTNLTVGGSTNTYFNTQACYTTYGCGGCDGYCGDESGGAGIESVWWYIADPNIASLTTVPSNYWAGLQGNSAGQTTLSVSITDINGCPGYGEAPVNVTCAVPVNFQVLSHSDVGGGVLEMHYAWGSSTGNLNDLSACRVQEVVTFDPPYIPYFDWPSPPFPPGISEHNPGIGPVPPINAADGVATDDYLLPSTNFPQPYSQGSFSSQQTVQYTCPCANGGNPVTFGGPNTITYSVDYSLERYSWYYSVSGWGGMAILYLQ